MTPHEAADVGDPRAEQIALLEAAKYETRLEVGRLRARIDELEELLAEARLQIEYLHDKFKETGSGNTVVARIRLALNPRGDRGS